MTMKCTNIILNWIHYKCLYGANWPNLNRVSGLDNCVLLILISDFDGGIYCDYIGECCYL